jgi:hypothetical protein
LSHKTYGTPRKGLALIFINQPRRYFCSTLYQTSDVTGWRDVTEASATAEACCYHPQDAADKIGSDKSAGDDARIQGP